MKFKANGENKPLTTTVIGSMKKPEYLKLPCWIDNGYFNEQTVPAYQEALKKYSVKELEAQVQKATQDVLNQQCRLGIDIVTDGEMRRDSYVHSFCRNMNGFDFNKTAEKLCRNSKSNSGSIPRVISSVSLKPSEKRSDPKDEWQQAQNLTDKEVKYTLPGPMTIADSVVNSFYKEQEDLEEDLVNPINRSILDLVKQGCKHIQIDEPVLTRYPERALNSGIKRLQRCFEGVPDDVNRIVHVCCGYPIRLDQQDYEKAEQSAYMKIAEALDNAEIDQISIEDAHRRNAPELFQKLQKKTIILGVVDVCQSRVESVDEIEEHIRDVLLYIPRERLMIAPDCGLIFLPQDVMEQKLTNMVTAARNV